jgi:hypothetical protein
MIIGIVRDRFSGGFAVINVPRIGLDDFFNGKPAFRHRNLRIISREHDGAAR